MTGFLSLTQNRLKDPPDVHIIIGFLRMAPMRTCLGYNTLRQRFLCMQALSNVAPSATTLLVTGTPGLLGATLHNL